MEEALNQNGSIIANVAAPRDFTLVSTMSIGYETARKHQRKLGYIQEPYGFTVKKNVNGLYIAKWSVEG